MSDPKAKGPGGRPTKYDPEFCERVIDLMEQGYSATAVAGKMRVARSTLYKWAEDNPEFSDALNIGRACAQAWWEDRLRGVAEKNEGNASAAIFGLKNRGTEDWLEADKTAAASPTINVYGGLPE